MTKLYPMITAVVLTKNEEKNIRRCLESLVWCDEVIVIDDQSSDKTVQIAHEFKTTVHEHPLRGDFSLQRNYGLEIAKHDWVFFVDADEVVSDRLRDEIIQTIRNTPNSGFMIKRMDVLWGRELKHGETAHIELLRLGRKGKGKWVRPIHEVWDIAGSVGTLDHPLTHYPHPTIGEFLEDINVYTTRNAAYLFEKKKKVSFIDILLFPTAKFIKNYIFLGGWMDGTAGMVHAMLMSFHSFLTRSKLWLLGQK